MAFLLTDYDHFTPSLGSDAILAFSLIALTVLVPAQRDPTKQRLGVYVWSFIFLAGVSVLFAVFRLKK